MFTPEEAVIPTASGRTTTRQDILRQAAAGANGILQRQATSNGVNLIHVEGQLHTTVVGAYIDGYTAGRFGSSRRDQSV